LERTALFSLRAYDKGEISLEETLDAVMAYGTPAMLDDGEGNTGSPQKEAELRIRYARTLGDRPWKACKCAVCRQVSIEVVIFRASNRNKRRGIHNLGVFKTLVDELQNTELAPTNEEIDLFGHCGAPESVELGAVLCGEGI
jgi:hypothetical protein